jgi:hypothetical protein
MAEWLDFHLKAGICHFWIYDNDSTDNLRQVIGPYVEKGIAEYIYFPGEAAQIKCYRDAIGRARERTRWLALIDADEFLLPEAGKTIPNVLENLPPDAAQLVVRWRNFGSSGHEERPRGSVLENYTRRAPDNMPTNKKCIVNPAAVIVPDVHFQYVAGRVYDACGNRIRKNNRGMSKHAARFLPAAPLVCNHYITKSRRDFAEKWTKGDVLRGGRSRREVNWGLWNSRDRNEVFDDSATQYMKAGPA